MMPWRVCLVVVLVGIACGTDPMEEFEQGPPGEQGPSGPQGEMGIPGTSVDLAAEPVGSNCAAGGIKIVAGSEAKYVCNGADATAPVGAVVAFAGTQAPPGWLLCDGSAVSRSTYAALFTVIGTAWGEGDATPNGTFNVPDLRGRFLRGRDAGTNRDPDVASRVSSGAGGNVGDRVGTLQLDSFRAHNHGGGNHSHGFNMYPRLAGCGFACSANSPPIEVNPGAPNPLTITNSGDVIATNGGSETRPANISVNYIIKF